MHLIKNVDVEDVCSVQLINLESLAIRMAVVLCEKLFTEHFFF